MHATVRPEVALLLLGLLLAACAASRPGEKVSAQAEGATPIYVVVQGWHTDIVLRRAEVPASVWPEIADFAGQDYVMVGWGDRDFYPAPRFNLWYGLKALFWPTASVLHVVGFSAPPAQRFPHDEIVELRLTREAVERLSAHIGASYERRGAPRARPLLPSPTGHGWFYPSRETFHLFKTCNVWTTQALRAAGLPVSAVLALSTESVMKQVRELGVLIQPGTASAACRATHG